LGCPKNEVDTELVLGKLVEGGMVFSRRLEGVDLVVLNTCAFIDSAIEESLSWISRLISLKRRGVIRRIAVIGCLFQRYKETLFRCFEEIDYFAGTGYPQEVGDFLLSCVKSGAKRKVFLKSLPNSWVEKGPRFPFKNAFYSYIKIAEGCNNRCAYCVIPSLRGPYRSKPLDMILEEAENLLKSGIKELILISQDNTLYSPSLPLLLRKLSELSGDFWIRVLYLYPARITADLLETILALEKVCSYLDIPVQHVNSRILSLMKRRYTSRELHFLFGGIRALSEDICLRTTVMLGFPGESREAFKELLSFVSDVRFDRLGSFIYSPQEGTDSFCMKPVPLRVARRRRDVLMKLQRAISRRRNELFVEKTMRVLVERPGVGRSYRDAPEIDGVIYFEGEAKPGSFINVKIQKAGDYDLWGAVEGRE